MNATFANFGYPETLIAEHGHWTVFFRPAQITPGSIILGANGEFTSFAALPRAAFTELREISGRIETAFRAEFGATKFNYIMLMMVDPHVHMHVLPRYPAPVSINGVELNDTYWPGPPDIAGDMPLCDELRTALQDKVATAYNAA